MSAGNTYGAQAFGFVTVTTSGTPVKLASSSTPVNNFTLQGFKAKGTANTGNVYVLDNAGNVLWTVESGKTFSPGPAGQQGDYDLSQFQLDAATSGDGVLLTGGIFSRVFHG